MAIRPASARTAFNTINMHGRYVLVDFRPREAFLDAFIRRALPLSLPPLPEELEELGRVAAQTTETLRAQGESAEVPRLLLVAAEADCETVRAAATEHALSVGFGTVLLYADSPGLDRFRARYPFCVLSVPTELRALSAAAANARLSLAAAEAALYANASFPFEVEERALFLGVTAHKNCARMLRDLGVTRVAELRPNAERHGLVEEGPAGLTVHVDRLRLLDLDEFYARMAGWAGERVLFCAPTLALSTPLLLGYLLAHRGMDLAAASLRVFGAIEHSAPDRFLYSQLLQWTPSAA